MAELLQTLPPSKAKHAARRSDGTTAEWVMYGWGLPIARGAAQAIKVMPLFQLSKQALADKHIGYSF